jgi:4-coumarate--CoA ligase
MANLIPVLAANELRIIPEEKPFDPQDFLVTVEKYQITSATIPPSSLAYLLHYEDISSYNLASLKSILSAGSIVSKHLRDKFAEQFPDKQVSISYGMTEASISMTKPFEFKKEFSVGSMLFPNAHVKIVDDDGNKLGVGEKGEICVKLLFKFIGYYNNLDATKNCFDEDDFFMTGDIGYFDEENMLYVVDRKKEILKYKDTK